MDKTMNGFGDIGKRSKEELLVILKRMERILQQASAPADAKPAQ